jgi:hypothetical protein
VQLAGPRSRLTILMQLTCNRCNWFADNNLSSVELRQKMSVRIVWAGVEFAVWSPLELLGCHERSVSVFTATVNTSAAVLTDRKLAQLAASRLRACNARPASASRGPRVVLDMIEQAVRGRGDGQVQDERREGGKIPVDLVSRSGFRY